MDLLRRKAQSVGLDLSSRQLEQFKMYYEALIKRNEQVNLTSITEYEEVVDKHFMDSILLGTIMDLNQPLKVMDMGTGGGFPGIPLKIAFPQLEITLLDSLNKRVVFLQEMIDLLELEGITAIHSRAEEAGRDVKHREQYDLCVSRAVANLSSLSEYCLPFVKVGGYFVSYKSVDIEEELQQAKHAIYLLSGKLEGVEQQDIPDSPIKRNFVKIKKTGKIARRYPRKAGTPTKQPLT